MDALKDYASESEDSNSNEVETSDTCKTENIRHDFFGIFTRDSSAIDDEKEKHGKETVVKKSVRIDNEKVTVEIPSTSFWSDLPSNELQVFQQTSKFDGRKVENSRKLYKKPSFQGHDVSVQQKRTSDSHGNQSDIKRQKASVECDTSFNKDRDQHETRRLNEKRKLFFIHPKITPLLQSKGLNNNIPKNKEWENPGHAGAINRLKWNVPNYSHLLVTCSMDTTLKLWNIWSQLDPCVQILRVHSKAVRDVAWNHDGKQLLSCSYDKSAAVSDAETGAAISKFEHSSFVTCCKYHPVNHHVCVTGSNNQIQTWDSRTPSRPCKTFTYKDTIGQVQDLVLTGDGSTLFSCSDLVTRDSADRNLMAWDFRTGVVLSNQIYQERFTLARLQLHPRDNQILAQSNGNYIAIFSLQRPYKMNKHKRFEGHKLQGYNIGFDVSPDGQIVYSGSADGKICCYNYQSGKCLRTISTGLPVVMDIACHPLLPSTIAMSSWDGTVQVWR
ncbi:WD repeat-containing protein 25-like [Mercenaria mercenaria]|uniref:WD repeat-containing protein 25-like n=1 Tax=Mercenaria mercenaria TaxID=6596 RepID=UPI00234F55C5|nr:WD repeat-containing protein 25-like [Mercenaria mercenaria]